MLVACHLTLCPRCREQSSWLDDLGGVLLDRVGDVRELNRPSPPSPTAPRVSHAVHPRPPAARNRLLPTLPRPVHPHLVDAQPRWRWLAPGIQHMPLKADGAAVRLLRFRKGFVIPEHAHAGLEWMLVLDGEVDDSRTGRRYGRGDVCRSETDSAHSQAITKDGACVALVANVAPVVPRSLLGRALASIVRL
jgi:putative transcriptional regulator